VRNPLQKTWKPPANPSYRRPGGFRGSAISKRSGSNGHDDGETTDKTTSAVDHERGLGSCPPPPCSLVRGPDVVPAISLRAVMKSESIVSPGHLDQNLVLCSLGGIVFREFRAQASGLDANIESR